MSSQQNEYGNAVGDISEHLKTYGGFLSLMAGAAGATVVTLLLMYFFLAR